MPFPRYCPNCGALVDEDATFCNKCGASLGSPQPTMARTYQPRSPYSPGRPAQPYELSQRLERAWGRAKLLSYAVIGLSVIVLLESMYWFGFFG